MTATKSTKNESVAKTVIYVTRDIERALGKQPSANYLIVANKTGYAASIKAQHPDYIFLVEGTVDTKNGRLPKSDKNPVTFTGVDEKELLDTHELLGNKDVEEFISEKKKKGDIGIVVFKNTPLIEKICAEKKWNLLNPSAALAEKIENKITQVEWLAAGDINLARYLPTHQILKAGDIVWGKTNPDKSPFILQWAHSHTGDGTALVRSEKDLAAVKEKFPAREARVSAFVNGPMFTANVCAAADILIGNISYQITGVLPFTDNPFSTIGNDWSVTHSILSPEKIEQFQEIAREVGEKMDASGWRGLFGIDCIYDEERDTMHLIEINARQPASTTYESQLQEKFRDLIKNEAFKKNPTIFEAHLAALQKEKNNSPKNSLPLVEINDGAQIIQRLTQSATIVMESPEKIIAAVEALNAEGFSTIEYANTKANSDLLRIQSARGIMEAHLKFNARGKKIVDILLA